MKRLVSAAMMSLILIATWMIPLGVRLARADISLPGEHPRKSADNPLTTSYTLNGNLEVIVVVVPFQYAYNPSGIFVVSGIPSGSTVERALMYHQEWEYSLGETASSTLAGNSLDFIPPLTHDSNVSEDLAVYRWDVTTIVTGNGAYTFSTDGLERVFGAALVVVYNNPANPSAEVRINDGAESMMYTTSSTTFSDVDSGSGRLIIYTEADDATSGTGEIISFNAINVGGPIDANQGGSASLITLPVTTVSGTNTASITTASDWFGWHIAILVSPRGSGPGACSPVYGKGIWITKLYRTENGDLSTIIGRLRSVKAKWVAIKCGDSDSFWLREGRLLFDWAESYGGFSEVIERFHDNGIRVLGVHWAVGYDVWEIPDVSEVDVADDILNIEGIDGFLINAETDTQFGIESYRGYLENLRSTHPSAFIAYTSYARSDGDRDDLHMLFTEYCDVSMPQAYWPARPQSPEEEIEIMERDMGELRDKWHNKPIMPMGQGGKCWVGGSISRNVYPGEIRTFCDILFTKGYLGISLFAYDYDDVIGPIMLEDWKWQEYSDCFNPQLTVIDYSPVDISITDPDGLRMNKTLQEIEGATYIEFDMDGDDDLEDIVMILHRKMGNYSIEVTPEAGANATDTFTLKVFTVSETTTIAENVTISEIPGEPYIFEAADESPPGTWINIGVPKFTSENITYVTPTTPVALMAQDDIGGSGIASTAYRIHNETYDGGWTAYTEPFYLQGLEDGIYRIDYNSTDNAENIGLPSTTIVTLMNHNIAATSITLSKAIVGQGFNLRINVTIQNQGAFTESFNVTLHANTTEIGMVVDIVLAGGNSTTITSTWNTNGFAKGNYTIRVVADSVPGETYMVDNTLIGDWLLVTLPGDVDGDRDVDIFDIVTIAGAYGTIEGQLKYNAHCDIDDDGDIDIFDLVRAAVNYGKSWG